MGREAKRSFSSLNKRPLKQIVLPRLISFGLFLLAPDEGICGRGQAFHLIKGTFHLSSPLSRHFSFHPFYLSRPLSLSLSSALSSIIRGLKVPFALTVPFWLALDAFWNSRLYPSFDVAFKWMRSKTLKSWPRCRPRVLNLRIGPTLNLSLSLQMWIHISIYGWRGSSLHDFFS